MTVVHMAGVCKLLSYEHLNTFEGDTKCYVLLTRNSSGRVCSAFKTTLGLFHQEYTKNWLYPNILMLI